MANPVVLKLLLLFLLGFSYVLSIAAVPSTRSLKPSLEDEPILPFLTFVDGFGTADIPEEDDNSVETLMERRMMIESNDYPDPGANRGHDPPGAP